MPLLALGIPPNAVMALMVGAMTIHGIVPGPLVMTKNPTLFWGVIASMLIGNLMLLVINLPLVGAWVRLLAVPYRLMFPAILLFSCIGIYSVNGSTGDVLLTALLALAGYALSKLDFETAPLLLGFVLGRRRCEVVERIRGELPEQDWFDLRREALVADPEGELSRLCLFLGQSCEKVYLADCARIVFASPHRSRHELPWTPELVRYVRERMARFADLEGYGFDTLSNVPTSRKVTGTDRRQFKLAVAGNSHRRRTK